MANAIILTFYKTKGDVITMQEFDSPLGGAYRQVRVEVTNVNPKHWRNTIPKAVVKDEIIGLSEKSGKPLRKGMHRFNIREAFANVGMGFKAVKEQLQCIWDLLNKISSKIDGITLPPENSYSEREKNRVESKMFGLMNSNRKKMQTIQELRDVIRSKDEHLKSLEDTLERTNDELRQYRRPANFRKPGIFQSWTYTPAETPEEKRLEANLHENVKIAYTNFRNQLHQVRDKLDQEEYRILMRSTKVIFFDLLSALADAKDATLPPENPGNAKIITLEEKGKTVGQAFEHYPGDCWLVRRNKAGGVTIQVIT